MSIKIYTWEEWKRAHPNSRVEEVHLDFTPTHAVFINKESRQKFKKPYKYILNWSMKNCQFRYYGFNHHWWFFEKPSDVMKFKLTFM